MKNIKLTIVAVTVAVLFALGTVSCQKDNTSTPPNGVKVEFADNTTNVIANTWESNDAIGIYMKKTGETLSATSIINGADNSKHLYNGGKFAPATEQQTIYYPASGAVDFIAYHPAGTIENGYIYKVSVADQTTPAAIDLLYSNDATGKTSTASPVALVFDHKLSKIVLTITSDEFSAAQLAGKTITATIGGMPVTADFKLTDGSFSALGAAANFAAQRDGTTVKLEAIVVPHSISDGFARRTLEVTMDGKTYKSGFSNTDDFESGKSYSYTASVGAQGLTITLNSILPWGGETIDIIDITEKFIDPTFRSYVYGIIGKVEANGDRILTSDVAGITSVDVWNSNIASLSGIEYFTALTNLDCNMNQLTSLDVSKNTKLADLNCRWNQLTSLDVSGCTALTYLDCSWNQLTSLDVSKNMMLSRLDCSDNSGDVNNNFWVTLPPSITPSTLPPHLPADNMTWVYDSNVITLRYYFNDITEEFSDATFRAKVLELTGDPRGDGTIQIKDVAGITSMDVSYSNIASLSGIEYFTALTDLDCSRNKLTSLDMSECTALTELLLSHNDLTSLDVSKNTKLIYFHCNDNPGDVNNDFWVTLPPSITTWTLPIPFPNDNMTWMYDGNTITMRYYFNDITEKFSDATFRAKVLELTGNPRGDGTIQIKDVAGITSVDVRSSNIASLSGIEYFTALTYLHCYDNQLTSLDVSGCRALATLNCHTNQLTSLDVSGCTALTYLNCNINKLTSLNVSQCIALQQLHCYTNQLTSLDVSKNTALEQLYFDINQLTSLDISKNTKLTKMHCNTNPGTFNGTEYKFKINVWVGFTRGNLPDPTNSDPSSFARGKWTYTPEGGAERTVTVEYVIPTR